ncbi:restriction endonuclease subunit S [Verminephrobacter eiseniae]|nr:restriction endonuclease subunit S [Verminephrobacter eiseniae]MCW5302020.1 restriction endonuclease subunit S [Verminephrobacter eiseniae]MCW8178783.1 restriction endonuclease subunit S [Verminephrobacter eiseniae]MCW8191118.1 restriction endonuclease subunit S [Verminephrobacter eiseniae]
MARITPCLENGKLARFQAPEGEPIGHGSTEFIVIRGKPNVTDNDYAYYLAISSEVRKFAISQMTGTSGRQRVPTDALGKISVLLPPLTEQKAIAHILGTLDDKIALNRRMNATLEAIAQVLFKSWFVDFDPVRAKMEGRWQRDQSLPGLPADLYDLFPERLVASELGEIPEGWAIGSFSEAVEIIGGGTPKTSVSEYWGGDIPWFSVVDTPPSSDVFVVQTEKSITRSGLNGSSARMIAKGTTIISARGTVGNLGIAGRDMTFNQSCYALRGKNGSGDYFVFLSAQCMVEQLKVMAHGSVFSTITRQTFDAVRFVLPPEPVLQQFERTATSVFDAIFGNGNDSRSLARLRGTLLPKLISGELRIQDAERIVGAAV